MQASYQFLSVLGRLLISKSSRNNFMCCFNLCNWFLKLNFETFKLSNTIDTSNFSKKFSFVIEIYKLKCFRNYSRLSLIWCFIRDKLMTFSWYLSLFYTQDIKPLYHSSTEEKINNCNYWKKYHTDFHHSPSPLPFYLYLSLSKSTFI